VTRRYRDLPGGPLGFLKLRVTGFTPFRIFRVASLGKVLLGRRGKNELFATLATDKHPRLKTVYHTNPPQVSSASFLGDGSSYGIWHRLYIGVLNRCQHKNVELFSNNHTGYPRPVCRHHRLHSHLRSTAPSRKTAPTGPRWRRLRRSGLLHHAADSRATTSILLPRSYCIRVP